jgi:hypothetical protein
MRLFLTLFVISHFTFAAVNYLPVAIEQAFIPELGYDDNDNIEIVIDGKLPNACFELHTTRIEIDQQNYKINLKQSMQVKDIHECQPQQQNQAGIFQWPIQYTTTVALGNLLAGTYKLYFNNGATTKHKTFKVAKANHTGLDDTLYAPVSDAFIPELMYVGDQAHVVLTGILTNSCMNFNQDIEVSKIGNVFIILPKMTFITDQYCHPTMLPLQSIVNLGELTQEGRYLIHIRSTSGRSVNKVFSIIKDPLNNDGRHHSNRK